MSQFDDGLVIDRAISAFEEDGFVVLRAVLSPESVSACRHAALDLLEHYWQRIRDMGESLGLGQRGGFHEIVQRHTGRYEVQLGRSDHDRPLQELLSRVLGGPAFRIAEAVLRDEAGRPDVKVLSSSCIIANEDCEAQAWHVDGAHLDTTKHLPCHCLNVFVPLVDVSAGAGTEFRPGSHLLTRNLKRQLLLAKARKELRPPVVPGLSIGDCVIFDYRTLHRGTRNNTGTKRPVLVVTLARSFFRDIVNFPSRSLYCNDDGETETQ